MPMMRQSHLLELLVKAVIVTVVVETLHFPAVFTSVLDPSRETNVRGVPENVAVMENVQVVPALIVQDPANVFAAF